MGFITIGDSYRQDLFFLTEEEVDRRFCKELYEGDYVWFRDFYGYAHSMSTLLGVECPLIGAGPVLMKLFDDGSLANLWGTTLVPEEFKKLKKPLVYIGVYTPTTTVRTYRMIATLAHEMRHLYQRKIGKKQKRIETGTQSLFDDNEIDADAFAMAFMRFQLSLRFYEILGAVCAGIADYCPPALIKRIHRAIIIYKDFQKNEVIKKRINKNS